MNHVPAGAIVTPGYDVSHYQATSIHEKMKAAGKVFCIIKADEGGTIIDSLWKAHYLAAKAAGMLVGFYNYYHPKQNPHAQSAHMLKLIGTVHGDLPPMCDFETTDGLNAHASSDSAFAFCMDLKKATGQEPILYGGPYFLRDNAQVDGRFAEFRLMIAHYGPKPSVGPLVPAPWKAWTFWQFTETAGIDLDLFQGSVDQLKALALS